MEQMWGVPCPRNICCTKKMGLPAAYFWCVQFDVTARVRASINCDSIVAQDVPYLQINFDSVGPSQPDSREILFVRQSGGCHCF